MGQLVSKRLVALVIAGVGLTVALSGCTKKSKQEYGLDIKETIRVNIDTEPPSLDWEKATDTTSAHVTVNLMDGLVDYNLSDPEFSVKPALALSWSNSRDNKTWTFKLRPGVKWTDGIEFTAQHVIDGWERLLNPATAAEYAYFLTSIKGAKAYNEGKLKDFAQVGVKATDPHTLVVELEKPIGYFPVTLTHHSTYPVRKDVIAKHGDKWTEPANIVTLGAFKLKVWDHDKALVLERYEDYFGEKPKIKNVLCYMITELSTALNLFEDGKLDAMTTVPATEVLKLQQKPQYKRISSLLMYYYGFNVKKKPMDNPLIRKAITMAIDRNELVQVLKGGQTPLMSWIPAGVMAHDDGLGIKQNIEEAKGLLKKAGVTDPSKLPKITIGFNTSENHKMIAENIQAQLKKNLGVNVELENKEWKVYLAQLKSDPPTIFRMGWQADYPDPSNFMDLMLSYSDNNHTNWKNPEYDKMVVQANSEADKTKRKSLYGKAQALLVEQDTPVAPLYNGVNQYMIADRVQNFPANALFRLDFRGTSLKQQ